MVQFLCPARLVLPECNINTALAPEDLGLLGWMGCNVALQLVLYSNDAKNANGCEWLSLDHGGCK